jgi:hypothetical protein
MVSPFGFQGDVGREWLEEDPLGRRGSFFSFINQKREPQRRYFQNQFQDIQNQFLGQLGQTIREGGVPEQTFGQFLVDFPFTERYQALPPAMRGALTTKYAPPVRTFL